MASKLINDPIYGAVNIDENILLFIDTPEFQRLHHIKQLSFCFHVYPGASHTRFEHSIGTMHLVGELIKKLKEVGLPDSLKRNKSAFFNDRDILCVKLAALLHDLGHGPFSHFWEIMLERFMKEEKHETDNKFSKKEFVHEEMTVQLIERMKENNSKIKELLEGDDVKFIQELIDPERRKDSEKESTRSTDPLKNFYYEIVSNKDNEIDLDKWDYIARDSHHVGINTCFETDRLMKTCHVGIDEDRKTHIVWTLKDLDNLALVFEQRKRLHRKVYQHTMTRLVSKMYEDVFEAAAGLEIFSSEVDDKKLHILKAHEDPDVFVNLNDGILNTIQTNLSTSHLANQQLRKIQKQDFNNYQSVGEVRLMSDNSKKLKKIEKELKEQVLDGSVPESSSNFKIIDIGLDFTKKEVNPLNDVYLHDEGTKLAVKASKKAQTLVGQYSPARRFEKVIKVFFIPPDDKMPRPQKVKLKKEFGKSKRKFKEACEEFEKSNTAKRIKMFYEV